MCGDDCLRAWTLRPPWPRCIAGGGARLLGRDDALFWAESVEMVDRVAEVDDDQA